MRHDPVLAGRSRRQFLRETVLTGLATVSGLVGVPASAGAALPGARVVVLGGGVAGLSAALELAERGFRVTVYERKELGAEYPGTADCDRGASSAAWRAWISVFPWVLLEPW
jgi:malic enzyme